MTIKAKNCNLEFRGLGLLDRLNIDEHKQKMIDAHYKLQELLEINNDDLRLMYDDNTRLDTSSYYIFVRSVCFEPGWADILWAVPKTMGTHNIGWSNVPVNPPDETDWYYNPRGTCTVFYPKASAWPHLDNEIRSEYGTL